MAVQTYNHGYLLPEESSAIVIVALIATTYALVFLLTCHYLQGLMLASTILNFDTKS